MDSVSLIVIKCLGLGSLGNRIVLKNSFTGSRNEGQSVEIKDRAGKPTPGCSRGLVPLLGILLADFTVLRSYITSCHQVGRFRMYSWQVNNYSMIKILHKWEIEKRSSNLLKECLQILTGNIIHWWRQNCTRCRKGKDEYLHHFFNILPVCSLQRLKVRKEIKLDSKEQIILFTDDLIAEKI